MKNLLYTFCLLLTFSCEKADTIRVAEKLTIELGQPFKMKLNDTATYYENELLFSFILTDILEDSRCPSDVTCIWQGLFTAAFSCSGCTDESFELGNGALDNPSTTVQNGYKLELLEINPTTLSTRTIDVNDYELTLMVSSN